MKLKNIFLIILLLFTLIGKTDCETYKKLKRKSAPSIKKSDLPCEFSDEAFKVVNEFIRKTIDLNFEILVYFDYITGEILKCKIGNKTKVKVKFKEEEFENHKVASIHNHTKNMYTPPSEKNFGIFSREWEDYELIAGKNCLWILKAKIKDDKLTFKLKMNSKILFNMVLDYYSKSNENDDKINDKIDEEYGKILTNYINNKNINKIQIIKRNY